MSARPRPAWVASLALLTCAGCARLDPAPDYDRAAAHVEAAVAQPLAYRPGADGVPERVAELLAGGLSADEAVQIALLNNAQLQAAFHEVGMARAEYVQSGLFSNPTLALAVRFPDGGGMAGLEADLAQNIAELWQIPYRREAGRRNLDRAILELAKRAAGLALDTKAAYHRALRSGREHELGADHVALTGQFVEIAIARRDAGSGSEIDVNLARAQHLEAQVQARDAARAELSARAELARQLGLTLDPATLALSDTLAVPPDWRLTAEDVIALARENRLDLRIAAETVGAALAQVRHQQTRFLREIAVGVSMEREAIRGRGDRKWLAEAAWASLAAGQPTLPGLEPREPEPDDWTLGPAISAELPIFDQNQAQIARSRHAWEQARGLLEALHRDLVQDAWQALERAAAARDAARLYAAEILPLRERGLELARDAYRSGRVTFLSVLEAQRMLLAGRSAYVESLQEAALALVELERLTGRPARVLLEAVAASAPTNESEGPLPPVRPAERAEDVR